MLPPLFRAAHRDPPAVDIFDFYFYFIVIFVLRGVAVGRELFCPAGGANSLFPQEIPPTTPSSSGYLTHSLSKLLLLLLPAQPVSQSRLPARARPLCARKFSSRSAARC